MGAERRIMRSHRTKEAVLFSKRMTSCRIPKFVDSFSVVVVLTINSVKNEGRINTTEKNAQRMKENNKRNGNISLIYKNIGTLMPITKSSAFAAA